MMISLVFANGFIALSFGALIFNPLVLGHLAVTIIFHRANLVPKWR